MSPRLISFIARPFRAALRGRGRASLAIALLPLIGACATMRPSPRPLELREADGAVWVRTSDAHQGTTVVLSGAPVVVLRGERTVRRDTLYVKTPFAIALPDGAFELQVAARRAPGAPLRAAPVAELRFTTVGERGVMESVRAEGSRLVLRRSAAGSVLAVSGAQRVETRLLSSVAAR